ncbi:NAD-dependent deacetylase [Sulfurimonas sp. MAG313]|nr:Sir2 family NAD-dependent protein deacetylase [Sulfurimonas sp. MAG313]MDF1881709.1 NAD-dependent deacetylase [Sulfurimonas sp. MAG313]
MIMIFSGAGLSAESGISTFRDHDGLWENYDVMQVCSTQGWKADRTLVTQFYNARRADLQDKKPNAAHLALASLEKKYPGKLYNLTQNVDNLLEKAGCKEVIHLHGTLTDVRCETCEHVWDVGYSVQDVHTSCPRCKSTCVRHNVVMFGEAAPAYEKIYEAIQECEIFIAIGTSGQVIDIVPIVSEFSDSILINPNKEKHVSAFGLQDRYIDEHFKYFLQMGAVEAVPEMMNIIEEFMDV